MMDENSEVKKNVDIVEVKKQSSATPSTNLDPIPASSQAKNTNTIANTTNSTTISIGNTSASNSTSGAVHWDTSKSVVMGLATGYPLYTYKQFVGSLRATGFPGHIILGIKKNPGDDVLQYFKEQNVTGRVVEMASNCTYNGYKGHDGKVIDTSDWHCAKNYPDYKITWGRFPLYRDWLNSCPECTDGVILTDVRDAYFQRDPFVTLTHTHRPLMVFEEIDQVDNTHWLTDFPVGHCKKHKVGTERMLCSGSVMGSREGILDYINVMVEEFDEWKEKDECRFALPGDDQSIHNYLYYTNRFKNATAIPHRTGPIHVVGYQAARIYENATQEGIQRNASVTETSHFYVKDEDLESKWQEWLPDKYNLIDPKTGLITNYDGSASAQVHQFDRFGQIQSHWRGKMIGTNWPYNKKKEKE